MYVDFVRTFKNVRRPFLYHSLAHYQLRYRPTQQHCFKNVAPFNSPTRAISGSLAAKRATMLS